MIDQLRLMNLLSPMQNQSAQGISNSPVTPNMGAASDVDIMDIAKQLEEQQNASAMPPLRNEAETQLRNMLMNVPTRDQYKPSVGRRILAGLASLSGDPSSVRAIIDRPYDRAVQDWQMKLKPLSEFADAERASNTNERLIAQSEALQKAAARKQDEVERANKEKERLAEEKLEIARERAKVYEFRSRNPGMKSVIDKDGMVVLYNPIDGTELKTKIDTGKLDDLEKADLQLEGRLEVVKAQAEAARKLEEVRQGNRLELEDKDSANQVKLKSTPSGTPAAAKTQTEAQKKIGLMNRYNQIVSQRPELAKYFEVKDGNVKVKPLGSRFSGMKETERMEAYNLLFPAEPIAKSDSDKSAEKIKVTKDGKNYMLPKSQLADAVKQGYTEVK